MNFTAVHSKGSNLYVIQVPPESSIASLEEVALLLGIIVFTRINSVSKKPHSVPAGSFHTMTLYEDTCMSLPLVKLKINLLNSVI